MMPLTLVQLTSADVILIRLTSDFIIVVQLMFADTVLLQLGLLVWTLSHPK